MVYLAVRKNYGFIRIPYNDVLVIELAYFKIKSSKNPRLINTSQNPRIYVTIISQSSVQIKKKYTEFFARCKICYNFTFSVKVNGGAEGDFKSFGLEFFKILNLCHFFTKLSSVCDYNIRINELLVNTMK